MCQGVHIYIYIYNYEGIRPLNRTTEGIMGPKSLMVVYVDPLGVG